MGKSALIGHTGFVGSNLMRQQPFDETYNSKNIDAIHGRSFDWVVCAAARAEKWKANQNPEDDLKAVQALMHSLERIKATEFILISTVDVYPDPREVDESSKAEWEKSTAYGRHRKMLEDFAVRQFSARVVRLPGLFGKGLKKNVIYDFLHKNQLEKIHAQARFQFYGLDRLSADLEIMRRSNLSLLNLATEPVLVQDMARVVFDLDFKSETPSPPARYDMRTQYSGLFSGPSGYIQSAEDVLADMKRFVQEANKL